MFVRGKEDGAAGPGGLWGLWACTQPAAGYQWAHRLAPTGLCYEHVHVIAFQGHPEGAANRPAVPAGSSRLQGLSQPSSQEWAVDWGCNYVCRRW